jgi:hypothetical protein
MEARTPVGSGSGKVGLQAAPLGVGKVALVCSSHARYATERASQYPFSDSFMTEFSEVPQSPTLCAGAYTSPSYRSMLQLLRGQLGLGPREGAGPLPAFSRDLGQLPTLLNCRRNGGRKEARNVRPDGHHPRLDLSIAHFR